MNTAQQRILNVIEAKIRAKGFDCAAQYDYSNTGTIYIYSEDDSVRAFAEVTFDFQGNTSPCV
jgi:hypothetical protein